MSSHLREKQLRKARYWCVRHDAEVFVKEAMAGAIDNLVREGVICPDNNSCTLRKVTPDGDAFFDITVTIPAEKVYMTFKTR